MVMSHVLSREKREQVIALGRLGCSLRRIEQATGVRRETAGDYLRVAGIALRRPGGWGRQGPSKTGKLSLHPPQVVLRSILQPNNPAVRSFALNKII